MTHAHRLRTGFHRRPESRLAGRRSSTANHTEQVFPVTVNYARTLADMVKAGNYGYLNDDINANHFPIKGDGKVGVEIVLVHFGKDIESDDALAELDMLGLRAATLPELLAVGETHPEVQREFPIIALGSVANVYGYRLVPYLGLWKGQRKLILGRFESRWVDRCRFAAVRK